VAADAASPLPALLQPLIEHPETSALFLDFDGTLANIVEDPVGARPLPGVPELLEDLALRFALVAVLSGRPPAFLHDVLGAPKGVEVIGLYGLARALEASGEAKHWSAVIDDVVAEAVAEAPEGVYVEPKGLTVTLHWRHAPEARPWVIAFVERERDTRGLRIHSGRMERELRPPVDVDKGTVIRSLAADSPIEWRAAAAFGDDMGDLPAFAALDDLAAGRSGGPPVVAVRVAVVDDESPPEVAAKADLTVRGAPAAVDLLRTIARAADAQA
jgi:trehalose 6-phosphate phosphatase